MTGKGKQIVDYVEGTGSNDLLLNDNEADMKRDKWNNENKPFFLPHEFFNGGKIGPFEEGEQSAKQNTNDIVQGIVQIISVNMKCNKVNEHSSNGNAVEGLEGWHTSLNQSENKMLTDK